MVLQQRDYKLSIILIMGIILGICFPIAKEQYLTIALLKATQRANIRIDEGELPNINQHIKRQSKQWLELAHCKILFQAFHNQPKEQMPMLPNQARLVVKPNNSVNNGLIVYQSGYYIGGLQNNRACGDGEMFLTEQLQNNEVSEVLKLIVRGKWNNDVLTEGRIFNRTEDLLLTVKWIREMRTINVKFTRGKIAEYTGDGEFTQARTLQEMLTGKCNIVFKDKSIYMGTVVKGKFDTQNSEEHEGMFETAQEKYVGGYVNGMRHGKSLIQRKQDGYLFIYELTWNMGVPDLETLKLLSSNPRATLFRMRGSQIE